MLIPQSRLTKLPLPLPSQLANSSTTIHPFFRDGPPPAVVVAGARRSGRATRPSNRITDPDNADGSSSTTTHKRKASGGMAAGRRINRRVSVDDEEYLGPVRSSDRLRTRT